MRVLPYPKALTIKAIAVKNGAISETAEATFTVKYADTAADPTFTPAAGDVAHTAALVISASGPIYYTKDDSDPRTSDTRDQYTNPLTFSGLVSSAGNYPKTVTIKAVVEATGYNLSGVVEADFTVQEVVAIPTFDPTGGTVGTPKVVRSGNPLEITSTTGAKIYYTAGANPGDPTSSSTRYSTQSDLQHLSSGHNRELSKNCYRQGLRREGELYRIQM